ncbi:MAG TPA: glycosyltransferase [Steroidobacteraceae bacterium]|jgi:glycosyltransferase involved in cell wall biosynthesis|nr:glycosyltransferase [Steroidobacteraceae bacterium]
MTIRYLHVIHSLDPRAGGPREGIKQLTAVAMHLNHTAEVLVTEQPEPAWVAEYSCAVHYAGPSYLKYGYAPRLMGWLKANARHYDAVVVNGLWQYHGLCTWQALHGTATPYFVFTHGMLDPWFNKEYPLKHLKKLMYWPWAEYRVLRDARAVLFTSEEERRLARQSFGRYRANEWVVNYGVPEPTGDPVEQREAFLQAFPQLRGKRFLLFLGRIHPKKGCDLLIEALAAVRPMDPSLLLVMAGPDQLGMQASLTQLAERLGIATAVIWTGMLRGDVKTGALRAAEAFVLPSHQENFGLAVAESMACATPVLISNKVNIWREVVQDGAGLAADDTLQGTIELLQTWIGLSPEERHRMARKAFDSFATRFNAEAAAESLIEAIAYHAVSPARSA